MEDGDGGQMGGTGGEGFAAPTGWMHLEDGDNDEYIRQENDEQCADLIKGRKNEKQQLTDVRIRARQGEQCRELTEEVIDCIETLKR